MPAELRKAHQQNDRAVMAAYGFLLKAFTESDCVAQLLDFSRVAAEDHLAVACLVVRKAGGE